jgi:hypothetical protein
MRMKPELAPGVPYPLGYAEATTSSLAVAAPLLSGASLALVGVLIVEGKDHFRLPDVTLILVVTASISLIASIQLGANARKYLYNQETIEAWYGKDAERSRPWSEQREHFNDWKARIRLAVIAFNAGTMLLILSVSSALLPRDNHAYVRWVSVGLSLAGALVESWWIYHLFRETFDEPEEKPK